jgi:retron-type reverse transcriptase
LEKDGSGALQEHYGSEKIMSGIAQRLAVETGLLEHAVRKIMLRAPVRYKDYPIPKRNGGTRQISQPAREVKLVQRALVTILISGLPVHEAATAYRPGASIRDNAGRHAGFRQILKLDFENFFPSIKDRDWLHYCITTGCLSSEEDIALTTSLLFRREKGLSRLRLAIGAPSSPSLSNALMFDFDKLVSERLSGENVIYSRYADDLTFSAPRTGYFKNVERVVKSALREIEYPRLKINQEKTTFVTTKFHRFVTGLTLANDGRVTIGRERKRRIRAEVHHFCLGKLDEDQVLRLSGTLAFVNAVEPAFLTVLDAKYGAAAIRSLQTIGRSSKARALTSGSSAG